MDLPRRKVGHPGNNVYWKQVNNEWLAFLRHVFAFNRFSTLTVDRFSTLTVDASLWPSPEYPLIWLTCYCQILLKEIH